MKRLTALVLVLLLLLTTGLPAAFAEEKVSSEEELIELLQSCKNSRKKSVEFTCSKDFYQQLSADDWRLMDVLEVKSGIDDASLSYISSTFTVQLRSISYGKFSWAECGTEKELRAAVIRLITREKASEFKLICPPELAEQIYTTGVLDNYIAQTGKKGGRVRAYTNGIIEISELEKLDLPYAVVGDAAQFDAAINGFAEKKNKEFYIVFDPYYFDTLSSDESQMDILHATSALDRYGYSSSWTTAALLHYYSVSYTDEPCTVCRSEDDVIEAIQRMGALGLSAFRLYLVGEPLRNSLIDDWKHLSEVEAKAGMTDSSMAYSSSTLYYSKAVIVANPVALASVEDAIDYVGKMSAAGKEEIVLFCTETLYSELLGKLATFTILQDGMDPIYDLIAHAGIYDYDLSCSQTTRTISIHIKSYYPGTEILRAREQKTTDKLPARLQKTLEAAEKLAEDCKADTERETARQIHDALCERIVYTDNERTDEDDTAVGALLNGKANCDGYADAFLLVGTLAGLEVRYQHGDSLVGSGGFAITDSVTHMWNLLKLDDSWRQVDVTWDDGDEGPNGTWFDLGQDRASRTHVWNEKMTVPLLEETELEGRPENEYAVRSPEELSAAIKSALAAGQDSFCLIFDDEDFADEQAALNEISKQVDGSYHYSWESHMRMLWIDL